MGLTPQAVPIGRAVVGEVDEAGFASHVSLVGSNPRIVRRRGMILGLRRLGRDIAIVVRTSRSAGGTMDDNILNALHQSQVIDLTTTGRRSGQPRRIEIFLHDLGGLLFITGIPVAGRTRDWIHNITADPDVVVHLKQQLTADIPAVARVVTDPGERRPLLEAAARHWGRTDVDEMVQHSPLIVLTVAENEN